ncbi:MULTISPECIES: ROK family protein [Acidobacterium]|uniref:ROK family protein n=1 Tax=Acidobacterium capsulatum (strain ATCC 51196 / DSM 11244 / BCRC 80197 / JCM 7670 / NBRC 15755 / NCIMB 13165 / 161) TaxID=240015 RepID=C1F1S4_ACIC5|nr:MULTISPECIES: ROK family protein [Acidobacterium]ACO34600.1 ROK family protein [Acidobacterium capsulatum ATCC 51196]HCT60001.1 ROK family protein [Acidobacterium sp.]
MAKKKSVSSKPVTLAVDIGGSHIKIMLLDYRGKPLSDRLRQPTPVPPTPENVLALLDGMRAQVGDFDRVSIGFPGVVKEGITYTAANLDPAWIGFPFAHEIMKRWRRPVQLANDAAVQGFGAIRGRGVELVLTLGTGLGSALYVNGHLCPGLELGHHPWRKGHSYEDYLGREGYDKHGKKKWNKHLAKAIEQTLHTFNWDHLYLGGGNAKKITLDPQPNITIVSNEDGLTGGVALWRDVSI